MYLTLFQSPAQLDHCPRISFHVGICPAGTEIDVSLVVLVLVNDLIRVSLTGVTAGVDLFAFAVPATGDLNVPETFQLRANFV